MLPSATEFECAGHFAFNDELIHFNSVVFLILLVSIEGEALLSRSGDNSKSFFLEP